MGSKQRIVDIRTPWGVDNITLCNRKHRKRMQRFCRSNNHLLLWYLASANRRTFYAEYTCYDREDMDVFMRAIRKRQWRTRVRRAPCPTVRKTGAV